MEYKFGKVKTPKTIWKVKGRGKRKDMASASPRSLLDEVENKKFRTWGRWVPKDNEV